MARLSNGTAARPKPKPVNPRRTEAASTPAITKTRLKVMEAQMDPGRSGPIMGRPVRAVHRSPTREPGWLQQETRTAHHTETDKSLVGARRRGRVCQYSPACRVTAAGGLRRFYSNRLAMLDDSLSTSSGEAFSHF